MAAFSLAQVSIKHGRIIKKKKLISAQITENRTDENELAKLKIIGHTSGRFQNLQNTLGSMPNVLSGFGHLSFVIILMFPNFAETINQRLF